MSFQSQLSSYTDAARSLIHSNLKESIERGDLPEVAKVLQDSTARITWACIIGKRGTNTFYMEGSSHCRADWRTRRVVISSDSNHEIEVELYLRLGVAAELNFIFTCLLFICLFLVGIYSSVMRTKEAAEYDQRLTNQALSFAHDIRSPLAALKQLLSHQADGASENSSLLAVAIQRINDIAEGVLNGAISRKAVPVSSRLSKLLDELVRLKRAEYNSLKINILLDVQGAHDIITTVPEQMLFRVLSNIVNNSVEAINSVSSCAGRENTILISVKKLSGKVEISVEDTGPGFSGSSIKSKSAGYGIGLKMARGFSEEFLGAIQLSSGDLGGARVALAFDESSRFFYTSSSVNLDNAITCSNRVLLLDDDLLVKRLWSMAAKRAGVELTVVSSWDLIFVLSPDELRTYSIYFDLYLSGEPDWDELGEKLRALRSAKVSFIGITTGVPRSSIPQSIVNVIDELRDKMPPF